MTGSGLWGFGGRLGWGPELRWTIAAAAFAALVGGPAGTAALAGQVAYVDSRATAANDGSSWEDAFVDLQSALDAVAPSGGAVAEIRVAQGVYRPSKRTNPDDPRSATFELVSGVALRGGYAGFGAEDPDARNYSVYETVLSGDLNGDDGPEFANYGENAYHVMTGLNLDISTVLEGVTVASGSADFVGHRFGGALHLRRFSIQVRSCVFRDNWSGLISTLPPGYGEVAHSDGGGAVSLVDVSRETPAVFEDCRFERNSTGGTGGGIFLGSASIRLRQCVFEGNTAFTGGGVGAESSDEIAIESCHLAKNTATWWGGGIYIGTCGPQSRFTATQFFENSATTGGGAAIRGYRWTMADCEFEQNSATNEGGGVYVEFGALERCRFIRNHAEYGGGAALADSDTIHVRGSLFHENRASREGGGVHLRYTATVIDGSEFVSNSADRGGALGISYSYAEARLERCRLRRNWASDGGAIWIPPGGGPLEIVNSELMNNSAYYFGGAIAALGDGLLATNLTLVENSAGALGGGIVTASDSLIWNSILWGNMAGSDYPRRTDELAQLEGGEFALVNYSCVQGLTGTLNGIGNTALDPLFADPRGPDGYWWSGDEDLRLDPSSPLIDIGAPFALPGQGAVDLDGHSRLLCGRVDIGAYEFGIGDYYCNGVVDLSDFADSRWCRHGPAVEQPTWCAPFDFDADLDVDLKDFAGFQRVFEGSP